MINTHHCKVRIKGKVEQSREKNSAPLHLGVVATEKGAFWSPTPLDYGRQHYFYLFSLISIFSASLQQIYSFISLQWTCSRKGYYRNPGYRIQSQDPHRIVVDNLVRIYPSIDSRIFQSTLPQVTSFRSSIIYPIFSQCTTYWSWRTTMIILSSSSSFFFHWEFTSAN